MFCDKKKVLESFNTTRHSDEYKNFLIVARVDKQQKLTDNELLLLLIKWKKKVKEAIHENDIGLVINNGNIFVIIHQDRIEALYSHMNHVHINKDGKVVSVISDILVLKKNESASIMRDHK